MKISTIEGIGPAYAEKLSEAGVKTTEGLLKAGSTKKGRVDLAATTNIPDKFILAWVNKADLMRIKGIGGQYSDLLEQVGVNTVKELRNRNADNLFNMAEKLNAEKKLVRRTPTLDEVKTWVNAAKSIVPMVKY